MELTLNRRSLADGSYAVILAWEFLPMAEALHSAELLTEGQRRHLIASLSQVEQALRRVIAITRIRSSIESPLLTRQIDDISPALGPAIHGSLADVDATLAEIVATFQLVPPAASSLSTVQAMVVSSLVVVEDATSRRLRGYGPVHPGLPALLDPLLDRLHRQLREIVEALPRGPAGEESSG
jgi:hypothetical protein